MIGRALKRAYKAEGGALGFWAMILGIALAFVIPYLTQGMGGFYSYLSLVPAIIAMLGARKMSMLFAYYYEKEKNGEYRCMERIGDYVFSIPYFIEPFCGCYMSGMKLAFTNE